MILPLTCPQRFRHLPLAPTLSKEKSPSEVQMLNDCVTQALSNRRRTTFPDHTGCSYMSHCDLSMLSPGDGLRSGLCRFVNLLAVWNSTMSALSSSLALFLLVAALVVLEAILAKTIYLIFSPRAFSYRSLLSGPKRRILNTFLQLVSSFSPITNLSVLFHHSILTNYYFFFLQNIT